MTNNKHLKKQKDGILLLNKKAMSSLFYSLSNTNKSTEDAACVPQRNYLLVPQKKKVMLTADQVLYHYEASTLLQ